jgi:regulator of sigma D
MNFHEVRNRSFTRSCQRLIDFFRLSHFKHITNIVDYFSFIKRLMEFLRTFTRIRKIELEIQTINDQQLNQDHPSTYLHDQHR